MLNLITDKTSKSTQQPALSTTGWVRVIPAGGAIASPQADVTGRGLFCQSKMTPAVWGVTQHRDPGSCSFNSLPKATIPDSPHATLIHSALPLLESRVSGCKWNFVDWPFKRLSISPALSPWQTEALLLYTGGYYLGSFPDSSAVGWGADLGVYTPYFSGEIPSAAEISLWNFSCHLWESSQPSRAPPILHTSHVVVKWFLLSVLDIRVVCG